MSAGSTAAGLSPATRGSRDRLRPHLLGRPPRSCCTTTWTVACARRPSSSSPQESGYRGLPDHRPGRARPPGSSQPATRARSSATWRRSTHTVGVMQTRDALVPRRRRVRRGPRRRRGRLRRGPLRPRAARRRASSRSSRSSRRCRTGFAAGAGAARPRPATRSGSARCSRPCGTRPARGRSPSWRCAYRDDGVVGFDIAGAEAGFPPDPAPGRLRVPAPGERPLHHPRRRGVRAAVDLGGDPVVRRRPARARRAHRRRRRRRARTATATLGRLAAYVRDKRIPLEMCPSSNVQTGAAASIAEHPIGLLRRLRFRVTVNTDNRLMSGTSMTRELTLLAEAFGYGLADLRWFTVNAMKSAFLPVRRAARAHRRRHQARLRRPAAADRVRLHPACPSRVTPLRGQAGTVRDSWTSVEAERSYVLRAGLPSVTARPSCVKPSLDESGHGALEEQGPQSGVARLRASAASTTQGPSPGRSVTRQAATIAETGRHGRLHWPRAAVPSVPSRSGVMSWAIRSSGVSRAS